MPDQDSRIFVYTPQKAAPQARQDESIDLADALRRWLFSPVGAICVWLLALGIIIPFSLLVLLLLREDLAILAVGCGIWLTLGLTILHWWIPGGFQHRSNAEGLAVAGLHVLTSFVATAGMAWIILAPDGLRPTFTLSEIPPIVVVGGIILVTSGTIWTLLRGYPPGRGLRYAWTIHCVLAVWMTLWLVAVHSGL
jgi:hypothetical protein